MGMLTLPKPIRIVQDCLRNSQKLIKRAGKKFNCRAQVALLPSDQ